MQGKVCVVTGANSGIGKVTCFELAKQGASVVMVCRNLDKAREVKTEIEAAVPGASIDLVHGDVSSLASVRRAADEIRGRHDHIDVLVNNAGVYLPRATRSADGFESTFATNHLGPFLLTLRLKDCLARRPGGRVVHVSSSGHRGGKVDLDRLGSDEGYSGMRAYCNTKLMNILFANELAIRWGDLGITSNSLHPGPIGTGFAQDEPGMFQWLVKIAKPFLLSPEAGARTQVFLASAPDVGDVTGEYFVKCKPASRSSRARDAEMARALWERSAELAAVDA